jgi:hypothetical protein
LLEPHWGDPREKELWLPRWGCMSREEGVFLEVELVAAWLDCPYGETSDVPCRSGFEAGGRVLWTAGRWPSLNCFLHLIF